MISARSGGALGLIVFFCMCLLACGSGDLKVGTYQDQFGDQLILRPDNTLIHRFGKPLPAVERKGTYRKLGRGSVDLIGFAPPSVLYHENYSMSVEFNGDTIYIPYEEEEGDTRVFRWKSAATS